MKEIVVKANVSRLEQGVDSRTFDVHAYFWRDQKCTSFEFTVGRDEAPDVMPGAELEVVIRKPEA